MHGFGEWGNLHMYCILLFYVARTSCAAVNHVTPPAHIIRDIAGPALYPRDRSCGCHELDIDRGEDDSQPRPQSPSYTEPQEHYTGALFEGRFVLSL